MKKHKTIVAISRQYPFGPDKAVQISRTACCDKGTQPQYFKQKSKITLLIRTSDLNIVWLFWFQTFPENFNNALRFNPTQLEKYVLKLDL